MADSLPPEQRGIGYATSSAVPGAVAILAPFAAGYLIDAVGVDPAMRYLYVFLLGAYAASATIQLRYLRDTVDRADVHLDRAAVPSLVLDAFRSAVDTLRWMPASLKVLAVVIALSFTANAIAGPFWVVYATERIGLTATEWGLLILIASTVRIALAIPLGMAVDRFGKRWTIIAAFALSVTPVLYFPHATGFLDVLAVLLLLSTSNATLIPACSALMADLVPHAMRGRVMAAIGRGALLINPGRGGGGGPGMGFVFTLPVTVASLLGGYIYALHHTYPWILQLAFLLASIALSVRHLHEPPRVER